MGGADNKYGNKTVFLGAVRGMQMEKGAEGVAREGFSARVIFKVTLRDNNNTATRLIWAML